MDPWYLTHNCDLGEGEVSVTLYPAGDSSVFVTQNWQDKQEIGHYKHKLSGQACQPIRDALRATNYTRLASKEDLAPETATMDFGEGIAGELPTVVVWALPDVPQPISQVAMQIRPLIDEVVKYPLRTLRGSAKLDSPTIPTGDPLQLEIVLSNCGIETLELHTPTNASSDGLIRLALTLAKDKPEQLLTEKDVDEVEIARNEIRIVSADGTVIREAPAITVLRADEELRLRVQKSGYLAPGNYRAVVKFSCAAGPIPAERTIEGTLTMKLDRFEVQ
jgi:hypothetical protein